MQMAKVKVIKMALWEAFKSHLPFPMNIDEIGKGVVVQIAYRP